MPATLLITISGRDNPGLTHAFAGVLAEASATVLDIGQAVIHDVLVMGMMVSVETPHVSAVENAVRRKASELGVEARTALLSETEQRDWVARQHHRRFVVTLLAAQISAAQLAAITDIFVAQGMNIDLLDRLSSRSAAVDDTYPRMCIDFTLSGDNVDSGTLRRQLLALADQQNFDVAVQEDSIFRGNRRLIVFDMDSTLIQMEVIDELARLAGVGDKVSTITEAAMRGELDFQASFRRRLGLLRGLPASALAKVAENVPITPGAHRLLRTLKLLGYKTAILSGGFAFVAEKLQKELGFDYVHTNELEIENGMLTGEPVGPIVDGARKAQLLEEIARREGISMEQTIAVGDGANDLPMLSIAGLGVAFHAKPLVREKAQHSISRMGLDALLYLLGLPDRHTEAKQKH
ncbi:MAG TPA: phosphoserine phosphatase SerB [Candidatus Angelobacter sp.]|nr:phosphoserine phosphatase SerB [Candidatus Angelobacter sp.]